MKVINKYKEKILENIKEDEVNIVHLQKNLGGYCANIICCEFTNDNVLDEYWQKIVDNVAINIQTVLNENIELYNVYIIFFIKEIKAELIYKIEQDKYSSRKIIIEDSMSKSEIDLIETINDRLFKFNVDNSKINLNLDEKLKNIDNSLYEIIKNEIDLSLESISSVMENIEI